MATISTGTTRHESGHYWTTFQSVATEASVSHLFEYSAFAGDATAGNHFNCIVEKIQMDCNTAGSPHILDGSAGNSLVGSGYTSDVTIKGYSQAWDFGKDGLVCLTAADNTSTLCVDMTRAGSYRGSVKYKIEAPIK